LLGGLLGGHSKRLAGAKTENQAVAQVIPAYDADLQQINASFRAGAITASQAIAALQQVAQQIKSYLMQQVGKPGTSWNESVGMAGQCNKDCTVGCCVWFSDLGPGLSNSSVALGGPIIGGWGHGDPRLQGTKVQVPTVYTSKYGLPNRAGYTLDWTPPAKSLSNNPVSTIQSAIAKPITAVESTLGIAPANNGGFTPAPIPGQAATGLSASWIALILGFLGVLAFMAVKQ
jgi:hypothetical protein